MHKETAEGIGQEEGLWPRRASRHRLGHEAQFGGLPEHVEAEQGASWRREDPLGSYVAGARGREPKAGAHVRLMNLKRVYFEDPRRFERDLRLFVDEHGLLGLFFERFPATILPEGKDLVAPNAGLDPKTRVLKAIEPATTGTRALEELLHRRTRKKRPRLGARTALPQELAFKPKSLVPTFGRLGPSGGSASLAPETLSWEEAEEEYGLRVVLDKHEGFGVSLLPTREPIFEWERELKRFPSGEDLTADNGYALGKIRERMTDASQYGYVGKDGTIKHVWRCPTLLTALYLMLWLDVYEGRSFPRCRLPDCGRYFRKGPQDTMYCSEGCADLARQRRRRSRG